MTWAEYIERLEPFTFVDADTEFAIHWLESIGQRFLVDFATDNAKCVAANIARRRVMARQAHRRGLPA